LKLKRGRRVGYECRKMTARKRVSNGMKDTED
jgi:hypothetical protein